jgi:hypothetical protein
MRRLNLPDENASRSFAGKHHLRGNTNRDRKGQS